MEYIRIFVDLAIVPELRGEFISPVWKASCLRFKKRRPIFLLTAQMELGRSVCRTHAQIVGAKTLFMTPKL